MQAMKNKKLKIYFFVLIPFAYFFIFFRGSFDYIFVKKLLFIEHIIKSIFNKNGVEVMFENDYLLYDSKYSKEVYLKYADKISDTKVLIGRKK